MRVARVIPCLDVDAGRVVKGTNFVDLVDAGGSRSAPGRGDVRGDLAGAGGIGVEDPDRRAIRGEGLRF